MKLSSQGGFLQQPTFNALSVPDDGLPKVLKKSWEKFCHELAKAAWPSVQKCLQKGKEFVDHKISQVFFFSFAPLLPNVHVLLCMGFFCKMSYALKRVR